MRPIYINQAQNEVFCHFLEFGSYVYLEIAYNHIFRQYFASSIDKTYEKKIAGGGVGMDKFGPNVPKSGPKLDIFAIFSSLI